MARSFKLFRLTNWTARGPKRVKGQPRCEGVISAGFKAMPGRHTVMLPLGSVAETDIDISHAQLVGWLVELGLRPIDDSAFAEDEWQAALKEAL